MTHDRGDADRERESLRARVAELEHAARRAEQTEEDIAPYR
jgi:hypothetical protein